MYTLELPALSLMTSIDSCHYANMIGLNDTLSFSTNADATKLTAVSIETRDLKYLASFERNPRKKRLMQEKQFEKFAGKAVLSKMMMGPRPEFTLDGYDANGEKVRSIEDKKAEE